MSDFACPLLAYDATDLDMEDSISGRDIREVDDMWVVGDRGFGVSQGRLG